MDLMAQSRCFVLSIVRRGSLVLPTCNRDTEPFIQGIYSWRNRIHMYRHAIAQNEMAFGFALHGRTMTVQDTSACDATRSSEHTQDRAHPERHDWPFSAASSAIHLVLDQATETETQA